MNNVSICCMQETEVQKDFPDTLLNCNGFCLELETCTDKKRSGIYLKNDINYTRRKDLEKNDVHIVIVDVTAETKFRLINVYRSFSPPGGSTATNCFNEQLNIIKKALGKNCYIMGDFNLDGGKDLRPDYSNMILLNRLKNFIAESNLIQVVDA